MLDKTTQLTPEWLTQHVFSFEVGPERKTISAKVIFEADGTIGGYTHPNEAGWRIVDGKLFILRSDGTPSCVTILVDQENGSPELAGPFLLSEDKYLHYFRPVSALADRKLVQTFDLFDTLVARTCVDPLAIFALVEAKSRVPGFANLRQAVEAELWRAGDYSFDDIYRGLAAVAGWPDTLTERLKMMELAEEWDNLFPIREMIARVQPGDVIISDMYLPEHFLRKLIDNKCDMPGLPLYLSNHGKYNGSIWPKVLQQYRISRHHGDNHHSDVAQARNNGIEAEHVAITSWSLGETILLSVGLEAFAKIIRKARLSSFTFDKAQRRAQLAQFDANIPMLVISAILLLRRARELNADTLLMCSRDCNMWVHLVRWMTENSAYKPAIHYFPSSRDLLLADDPVYAAYFTRLRGDRTMIVDISGTGRSPSNFIARMDDQSSTSVFVSLKSDRIDPPMEQRAPARDDVAIDFAIPLDLERFLFERFNTAAGEDRATGMKFVDYKFEVVREQSAIGVEAEKRVLAMRSAFTHTMSLLQEELRFDVASDRSTEDLREAMFKLVQVAGTYFDVAEQLPG